jgi:hypothetical protein
MIPIDHPLYFTDIDRPFTYHREEKRSVMIVMLKTKKGLIRKKALLPMMKKEMMPKLNQPKKQRSRNQLKKSKRLRAFGSVTCHSPQPKQI